MYRINLFLILYTMVKVYVCVCGTMGKRVLKV